MAGVVELDELLNSMSPEIQEKEYVFCCAPGRPADYDHLAPLATFRETEGLTLILPAEVAAQEGFNIDSRFRQITLSVHSSLNAVGLTAAVSTKLAAHGISANVVAAYYHDHIFVPSQKAEEALRVLQELTWTKR
ncbi:ACT domain-containing protein [Salinicola peritrichatus]|uniref:ACT domain-containing protein n=1 Tax=Salinicola peritrichatus TaxID=1267424 RepID=UPI000DA20A4E|nr:ACT domain-containing protein [Salinicola peritrichatus]